MTNTIKKIIQDLHWLNREAKNLRLSSGVDTVTLVLRKQYPAKTLEDLAEELKTNKSIKTSWLKDAFVVKLQHTEIFIKQSKK